MEMRALAKFGWVALPGASTYALMSPVNVLVVPPPDGRWLVNKDAVTMVPRISIDGTFITLWALFRALALVHPAILAAYGRGSHADIWLSVCVVLNSTMEVALFCKLVRQDLALHRRSACYWPEPFVSRHHAALAIGAAILTGFFAYSQLVQSVLQRLPAALHASRTSSIVLEEITNHPILIISFIPAFLDQLIECFIVTQ